MNSQDIWNAMLVIRKWAVSHSLWWNMSRNFVWAIDYYGSLSKLNLSTQEWETVQSLEGCGRGEDSPLKRADTFKRITTTTNCAWAICGDQNIYVNVFDTDLPIKLQVSCYENERWSVISGWGKKSVSSLFWLHSESWMFPWTSKKSHHNLWFWCRQCIKRRRS